MLESDDPLQPRQTLRWRDDTLYTVAMEPSRPAATRRPRLRCTRWPANVRIAVAAVIAVAPLGGCVCRRAARPSKRS